MEKRLKVIDKFKDFIRIVIAPEITITRKRANAILHTERLRFSEGFEKTVNLITKRCVGEKNKLIFIGNGGSAAIASHQALDFFLNLNIDARAFNDGPFLTCMANDFGFENVFEKPIQIIAQAGDVLAAISSSGKSPNILKAIEAANRKRCFVITMSGFKSDNPLRKMGNINFYVSSHSYRYVEAAHSLYWDFILELLIDQEYEKIKK
jgi:D-sedoheptulose 7-phosphate isomerase